MLGPFSPFSISSYSFSDVGYEASNQHRKDLFCRSNYLYNLYYITWLNLYWFVSIHIQQVSCPDSDSSQGVCFGWVFKAAALSCTDSCHGALPDAGCTNRSSRSQGRACDDACWRSTNRAGASAGTCQCWPNRRCSNREHSTSDVGT